MDPGKYDIRINQRATFVREIILPIDLTGHLIYAQVWDEKRRKKIGNFDVEMIDASEGHFRLKMDWPETTLLKKPAFWDLMVVYANGQRDYWLEGKMTVDPGLTAPEDE